MQVLSSIEFILALLILVGVGGIAYPIAKPGCPDSCGNVSIPYPFGIGRGCYKDEWFEVTCNSSFPVLQAYKSEVLDIAGDQLEIIYKWDFLSCGSEQGSIVHQLIEPSVNYDQNGSYSYNYNPFTFSPFHNKLVGIGCDTYSFITYNHTTNYTNGCVSLCPSNSSILSTSSDVKAADLSTIIVPGVCQTTIPADLKSFHVNILTIVSGLGGSPVSDNPFDDCHHAFIVKHDFRYVSSLVSETPVVLYWILGESGNFTSKDNACGSNAHWINNRNGKGYHCKCNRGYAGNPYLHDGCQDIDECKNSKKQLCEGGTICENTAGSYFCGCPHGFHREHNRCIRNGPQLRIGVIIALGFAFGLSLAGITTMAFWCKWRLERQKKVRLRQRFFKRNGGVLLQQQMVSQQGAVCKTLNFVSEDLEKATDNFNECRICGKGGFGTVYKGMLLDGRIVAIKKSRLIDETQVVLFINEVVILSQINHRNVVKLLGCCLETEVPLLVYEFVCNGTLFDHLHGKTLGSSISWENRLRIATEIAGALAYLHSAACTPIFHRDVKSSNILLDENYKAKVADFGLSRSISNDKTHLSTKVQGTFGYLDPEYFQKCQFTDKSDVYSFGVVLVELLTGEKAVSDTKVDDEKSLVMNFISAMKENRLFDIVEARVLIEAKKEELLEFAMIAKICIKLNGKRRPSMKEVAQYLETMRKSWYSISDDNVSLN